jgi:hypothetical protein
MLKEFGHEIWTADGPDVAVLGFHYPTRMAIIRLSDGGLFISSPIRLSSSLRAEVDAVGQVRHIIAPIHFITYFFQSGSVPTPKPRSTHRRDYEESART